MNEEIACNILREVKDVLDGLGIQFWLESGALLGAIREKKFIKWDYDIDLGTWDKYIPKMKIICKRFSEKGYEVYYSKYNNGMGLWKDGISIDLPFWRLDQSRAVMPLRYIENFIGKLLFYADWIILFSHYGKKRRSASAQIKFGKFRYALVRATDLLPESIKLTIAKILNLTAKRTGNRRGLVVTPSDYFLNLTTIEFYGMNFYVPEDTEGYLAYYFGDDWKVPRKDWNYVRKDRVIISKTERIGEKWKYMRKQSIECPESATMLCL